MTRTYSLALYRYNSDEPCLVLEEDEFTIECNVLTFLDLSLVEFEEICDSSAAVLRVFDEKWNTDQTLVTFTPCHSSAPFGHEYALLSLKNGKFSLSIHTEFHREEI